MTSVTVRRSVAGPPAEVWPRVLDLGHVAFDDPHLELLTDHLDGAGGTPVVGATATVQHRAGPRLTRTDLAVVDLRHPHLLVLRAEGPRDERWWVTVTLDELRGDGEAGTDLTLRAEPAVPTRRWARSRVAEDLAALLEGLARAAARRRRPVAAGR